MKVLYQNVSYFREVNGGFLGYLATFPQLFYYPSKPQLITKINESIGVGVDLIALTEIPPEEKLKCFAPEFNNRFVAEKYHPNGFLKHMPFFKGKSNGFFSKIPSDFHRRDFSDGGKTAILEMRSKDYTFILLHLPLTNELRKKQLKELSDYVDDSTIILGDFNCFGGVKREILPFCKTHNLIPLSPGRTFPALKPKYELDLALIPKKYQQHITIFPSNLTPSDHMGFILNID